jgi:hypothetical protein
MAGARESSVLLERVGTIATFVLVKSSRMASTRASATSDGRVMTELQFESQFSELICRA